MIFFVLSALFTIILSQSLGFLPARLLPKSIVSFNNKLILPFFGSFFLITAFAGSQINSQFNSFHVLLFASGLVLLLNPSPKSLQESPKRLIYNLPVLILIFTLVVYLNSLDTFRWLIKEDHLYENLQFIFYLVSGIIYLLIFKNHKKYGLSKTKRGIFFLLSLGLLFTALEEISWGQRIFNFNTPESLKKINSQDELTIHNLYPIQNILHSAYIITGIFGAFSYKLSRKYSKKFFINYKEILPPPYLFVYFFATAVFYFFNDYVVYYTSVHPNVTTLNHWQEVFELFFSAGFFLTAINTKKLLIKSVGK